MRNEPEFAQLRRMETMELLTTKQAAEFLGVSMAFLERDRWAGARIPFVRIGSRTIRYLKADLESYVSSRRVEGKIQMGGQNSH